MTREENEIFPRILSGWLIETSLGDPTLAALLVITMLLVLGFFVDVIALMIIFTPVLAPMAARFGFDPVHWALLMYDWAEPLVHVAPMLVLYAVAAILAFNKPRKRTSA